MVIPVRKLSAHQLRYALVEVALYTLVLVGTLGAEMALGAQRASWLHVVVFTAASLTTKAWWSYVQLRRQRNEEPNGWHEPTSK